MPLSTVHFSSVTNRWATPKKTYADLNAEFHFDLDPCPIDSACNGLNLNWRGKRVFCNPPYGPDIGKWLALGLEAKLCVFLLPARTDTKWFHEIVLPMSKEVRFIRGRLRFSEGRGRSPFPSMVVVFEKHSKRKQAVS